jgi:hypothetical protein
MLVWTILFAVFVGLIAAALLFAILFPTRLPPHHEHRRITNRHRFRQAHP